MALWLVHTPIPHNRGDWNWAQSAFLEIKAGHNLGGGCQLSWITATRQGMELGQICSKSPKYIVQSRGELAFYAAAGVVIVFVVTVCVCVCLSS